MSKIREEVFDHINLNDLKKETDLQTSLDKHPARDRLADNLNSLWITDVV